MDRTVKHNLSEISILSTPAIAPGLAPGSYVEILRGVAREKSGNARRSADVTINLFERWIKFSDSEFQMGEDVLDRFQRDLESGRLRGRDRQKYASSAKSAPVTIRILHNEAVDGSVSILRPLLNRKTFSRLERIAALSPATQDLLLHVERAGQRKPKRGRASRPLTPATRRGSINATLTLLTLLDVNGIEAVTPDVVNTLMEDAKDKADSKRIVRMLHNASVVFRIAAERKVIAANPMDAVPHDTFSDQAKRPFLMPEEVGKVRDLTDVNQWDWKRIRNRLIVLFFLDTALRLNELVAVRLDDLNEDAEGEYNLHLRASTQKGDKRDVVLPILYQETAQLLHRYLSEVRPQYDGDSLFVTDSGMPASQNSVIAAVKREAERLDLTVYHSNSRPSPHALRRTFGMLNAAPLGLNFGTHELALRMRDSLKITYSVYVQDNPVLAMHRGAKYRRRTEDKPRSDRLHEAMATLRAAGLPSKIDRQLKTWVSSIGRIEKSAGVAQPNAMEWINEPEAVGILRRHWDTIPRTRVLRDHMRAQGALRRAGRDGCVMYSKEPVQDLASRFIPIADHLTGDELKSRAVRSILSGFALLAMGSVKLVAVEDVPAVSRALATFRFYPKETVERCSSLCR